MQHRVFTVHDTAAQAYLPPFFMPTIGMARRAFADMCNDPGHAWGRNPSDYTLFTIGYWDDQDAKFTPLDAPEALANGLTVLHKETLPLFPTYQDGEPEKAEGGFKVDPQRVREHYQEFISRQTGNNVDEEA